MYTTTLKNVSKTKWEQGYKEERYPSLRIHGTLTHPQKKAYLVVKMVNPTSKYEVETVELPKISKAS